MPQLRLAYSAAEELREQRGIDFVLFLSFDMAAGEWPVVLVISCINEFKDSPAQFKVNDLPFVSTFEGPRWANNWPAVREATGGIYFVPDWSSLGPHGVGEKLRLIDGACEFYSREPLQTNNTIEREREEANSNHPWVPVSWAAWPRADQHHMTTEEDVEYQKALRGKSFMAGVSPWFYTSIAPILD